LDQISGVGHALKSVCLESRVQGFEPIQVGRLKLGRLSWFVLQSGIARGVGMYLYSP
jgi:hypothetical protein